MYDLRNIEPPKPFIGQDQKPYLKYGYRLNLNYPFVRLLFDRWLKREGILPQYPLSDAERLQFEAEAIPYIERQSGTPAPPPYIPCGPYRDSLPVELVAKIYHVDTAVLKNLQKK